MAPVFQLLVLLSVALFVSHCNSLDVSQSSAEEAASDSTSKEATAKQLRAALMAELYSRAIQNDQSHESPSHHHAHLSDISDPLESQFDAYSGDDLSVNQKPSALIKRFSEFLGGKRKRFSEFLGGKKRFSEFLGGKKRSGSLDKRFSEFLGGKRSGRMNEREEMSNVYDQQDF